MNETKDIFKGNLLRGRLGECVRDLSAVTE